VSYGLPEKADAKWLDHQGSFMAAPAAQPVFRLLGATDDGTLAWRQHDGGHTDAPNWKYFLSWADFAFHRGYTPGPAGQAASSASGGTR
jgi:hypothetical protein